MNIDLLSMKSDAALLDRLKKAASMPISPEDRFEQRVSFVFGSLGKNNTMTKADVRRQLREQMEDLLAEAK